MGYIVLSIVVLLLLVWLWAIGATDLDRYRARHRQAPAVDREKLAAFRAALLRFDCEIEEPGLSALYAKLEPGFDNPNLAAMEHFLNVVRRLGDPGAEVYSRPAAEIRDEADAAGNEELSAFKTICEFTDEGLVSREDGRRYFDQVKEVWSSALLRQSRPAGASVDFDSMLVEIHNGRQTGHIAQ